MFASNRPDRRNEHDVALVVVVVQVKIIVRDSLCARPFIAYHQVSNLYNGRISPSIQRTQRAHHRAYITKYTTYTLKLSFRSTLSYAIPCWALVRSHVEKKCSILGPAESHKYHRVYFSIRRFQSRTTNSVLGRAQMSFNCCAGPRWRMRSPARVYRATSLIRNCFLLGPCSRPMPRALWWS